MILTLQIKSLAFTFIYGIFFAFTYNKNKKILLNNNLVFKIIINLLFMSNHALIYFIGIRTINNCILHIYLPIFFILGILFYNFYFTSSNKDLLTE